MYNKVECIVITCDNCKETYTEEHSGFSFFADEDNANDNAQDDQWYSDEGKHYCPECHTINDHDELVIDYKRQALQTQVATNMPVTTSLDNCPFHYCDNNPKCETVCKYSNPIQSQ